jgi:hypothetical protein
MENDRSLSRFGRFDIDCAPDLFIFPVNPVIEHRNKSTLHA